MAHQHNKCRAEQCLRIKTVNLTARLPKYKFYLYLLTSLVRGWFQSSNRLIYTTSSERQGRANMPQNMYNKCAPHTHTSLPLFGSLRNRRHIYVWWDWGTQL
jgi:hypothetical protein